MAPVGIFEEEVCGIGPAEQAIGPGGRARPVHALWRCAAAQVEMDRMLASATLSAAIGGGWSQNESANSIDLALMSGRDAPPKELNPLQYHAAAPN